MATGGSKRKRSQRVAALELPPGLAARTFAYLHRGGVLARIGLCLLTAIALWLIMGRGVPPFHYREGYVPPRTIYPRVAFERPDPIGTQRAKERAQSRVPYVYNHDPSLLRRIREDLHNALSAVQGAESLEKFVEGSGENAWRAFLPEGSAEMPLEQQRLEFERFRDLLKTKVKVEDIDQGVKAAFAEFELLGLLKESQLKQDAGNPIYIDVIDTETGKRHSNVKIDNVRMTEALPRMVTNIGNHVHPADLHKPLWNWLKPKLSETNTLKWNHEETANALEAAVVGIEEKFRYRVGEPPALAEGNKPLTKESLELLRLEYDEFVRQYNVWQWIRRSLAIFGMFVALYTLCGFYAFNRERKLVADIKQFSIILLLVAITVGLCMIAARDQWRAELIPLLLFGMTIAIAYHQEIALLLSAAVALIVVVALGQGLFQYVVFLSGITAAVLTLGRIRSRRKLIYVGLWSGLVVSLTFLGVNTLDGQPLNGILLSEAVRVGLWAIVAGFLMTGLLPFVENLFGVLTDISLLELGDVAHPLLQELVRRAPGTYNHSINVASISEAAAESIGARGLLVRVGAYFHDIGKMLKPGYFVENQGQDANRHESLVPAMSTLIIIAHIKDGADLARQHHVPQPIIDFIQQHHGTTLVEYFYRRANEQCENNPYAQSVDESAFRYPGPKPQTKEAGVLMVADAVESASRALAGPTPARIESLVHDIVMKRLLDGQFDECGLTLQEVHTIEESLVKSLTAVYHGRIKYPGQRTA